MKKDMQIQLAWKIIEFLETIADLILEYYIDESIDANRMKESIRENPPWAE
jgi:hypothetical protein